MTESGTVNIIGFAVLAFSLLFAYAGTLETCTYRRYIIPAMLLLIAAMVLEEIIAAIMIVISSVLIYIGYKGHGTELRKKEDESKKEEKKESKEDKKEESK